MDRQIVDDLVKEHVGPVHPFAETYDFESADEATDAELAALPHDELRERLLAARNAVAGPIKEIGRGYWGDMRLTALMPFPQGGPGWTQIGSPEWLDELFPPQEAAK
jgi:hypothetical protein